MDRRVNQLNPVHFQITTRCDACNQSYHSKAKVRVSSIGFRVSNRVRNKLDQMVKRVLSDFGGVGVQRCPYCGHIQAWNVNEVAEIYAHWWALGISLVVFLIYFITNFNSGGLDPTGPKFLMTLLTILFAPLLAFYVSTLISRIVARGYYLVRYNASENNKPEIRVVDEM